MGQNFRETEHFKTDLNKYGKNYDHILKKKTPEIAEDYKKQDSISDDSSHIEGIPEK